MTIGDGPNRVLLKYHLQHNHEEYNINILKRQEIAAAVKRKATDDVSDRPSKIIHSEIKHNTEHLNTQDINCIKQCLYRARRKLLPALPTSIEEIHTTVETLKPKTVQGEEFLMVNDGQSNIIIFTCASNLTVLCRSKIIYMDGTFQYCVKYFKQLFTIHALLNGHYIPVVFCLLNNKNSESYQLVLKKIEEQCHRLNLVLRPASVVIDFEKSIHLAIESVWPMVEIKGCRFHLSQSWWRKIQQLGLSTEYKDNNSEVGRWLHYCLGLVFLDHSLVSDAFIFELCAIRPNDDRLTAFSDYLVDTYISEDAIFPPVVWAEASAALIFTTNACESFHSHFKENFYSNHPSIFVFLEVLNKIQSETYIKCNSVGTPYKYRNNVTRKRQLFLEEKLNMFRNRQLPILDFLKIVSYQYSNF